jgi:hypothetical protein
MSKIFINVIPDNDTALILKGGLSIGDFLGGRAGTSTFGGVTVDPITGHIGGVNYGSLDRSVTFPYSQPNLNRRLITTPNTNGPVIVGHFSDNTYTFHFKMIHKPNWIRRKLVKLLLGYHWIQY